MSVSDKDSLVVARSERTPPAAKLERTPADKPLPAPERLAPAPDRPMSFGRTMRAARPMGADRQFHRTRGISPLTRRILFFNVFALIILIGGVLWVQSSRAGLVQERIAGIRDQALIVAGALAEYTAIQERRTIDTAQAEPLLRQLIAPTHLRARVYTTNGQLLIDTRNLLARNIVVTESLPPPESSNPVLAYFERGLVAAQSLYDRLMGVRPLAELEPYFEAGQNGRVYGEVNLALDRRERFERARERAGQAGAVGGRSDPPVRDALWRADADDGIGRHRRHPEGRARGAGQGVRARVRRAAAVLALSCRHDRRARAPACGGGRARAARPRGTRSDPGHA